MRRSLAVTIRESTRFLGMPRRIDSPWVDIIHDLTMWDVEGSLEALHFWVDLSPWPDQ